MGDVARLAGVSRTTVSFVLNDRESRIPEATRRRVEKAARDLNFRPSVVAQQLRTSRSKLIGLIADEIASGPFAGGLIAGAQSGAEAHGYTLAILNTSREGDLDVDLGALRDRGVDALVFATVMTRQVHLPSSVTAEDRVVLLNCFDPDTPFAAVLPGDEVGQEAATDLVVGLGHRRIALVTGVEGTWPVAERLKGYRRSLEKASLRFDPDIVKFGGWNADTGYALARELFLRDDPPTALMCGNDRIALGVIDAAREASLDVPRDVSIFGYDDQAEIVAYTRPALSTVRLPYREMGAAAISALFEESVGRHAIMVPCVPVVRDSLGPAPAA